MCMTYMTNEYNVLILSVTLPPHLKNWKFASFQDFGIK